MELTVALLIVSLLLGGLMMPLSAQRQQKQDVSTTKLVGEAREALRGYTAVNGRVPCPAVQPGGAEDPVGGGHCTNATGYFPDLTIGLQSLDEWGNPLRYAVATTFTDQNATPPLVSPMHYYDTPTTTGGFLTPMPSQQPELITSDLRACSTASKYRYVISGATACPAGTSIGEALAVAVWSDGQSQSTDLDNLTDWPSPIILRIMTMVSQGLIK